MSLSYMQQYRRDRKMKAISMGVEVKDLPYMCLKIKNTSNYYTLKHHNYLYSAAWKIVKQFSSMNLDVDELVDVGWFECARYHKDITREYKRILIKMFNFAIAQARGVAYDSVTVPVFVKNTDEVLASAPFRDEVFISFNDNTDEQVSEIYKVCSPDECRLLDMRFRQGLTYKEIGALCGKSFSNMIIKYQRLFERIRKRLRGEETRGLRAVINA